MVTAKVNLLTFYISKLSSTYNFNFAGHDCKRPCICRICWRERKLRETLNTQARSVAEEVRAKNVAANREVSIPSSTITSTSSTSALPFPTTEEISARRPHLRITKVPVRYIALSKEDFVRQKSQWKVDITPKTHMPAEKRPKMDVSLIDDTTNPSAVNDICPFYQQYLISLFYRARHLYPS